MDATGAVGTCKMAPFVLHAAVSSVPLTRCAVLFLDGPMTSGAPDSLFPVFSRPIPHVRTFSAREVLPPPPHSVHVFARIPSSFQSCVDVELTFGPTSLHEIPGAQNIYSTTLAQSVHYYIFVFARVMCYRHVNMLTYARLGYFWVGLDPLRFARGGQNNKHN